MVVKKRPEWTTSRLAEVKAVNAANIARSEQNESAAKPEEVSGLTDEYLVNDAVKTFKKQGLLRTDCDAHKAWIDPAAWEESSAADKEALTRSICLYCHSDSINIYDAQSGKKIARYGSVLGFRVY